MMPLRSVERVGARQVRLVIKTCNSLDMGERVREQLIPRQSASLPLSLSLYICKLGHYAKHEG